MISNKRTIAILLTAVLALSLMLTACSKSGDTPTGDNSMPGVTDTQTPDNTPGATDTSPDNTPDATDPSTPGASETPTDEKQYGMPTWADPSEYDTEKKADVDMLIEYYGELYGVDIDKLIEEVIAEYGQYVDVHITPESIRTAIIVGRIHNKESKYLSAMPESSINKANDFLISKGLEKLDFKEYTNVDDVKKDLACLAIAASVYYELNYTLEGDRYVVYDLYDAFSRVLSGTGKVDDYLSVDMGSRYYILP